MMTREQIMRERIGKFFASLGIDTFGLADLSGIAFLEDDQGNSLSWAISFAVAMNPEIMAGVKTGPTEQYADEYTRVNRRIDAVSGDLAALLKKKGFSARAIAASERSDPHGLKGEFPHKTAATRAGLGWIGRNCQLITKKHGPWIRLGTVLANYSGAENCRELELAFRKTEAWSGLRKPVVKSYCGHCRLCVDACPAAALVGNLWRPGIPREQLLDAHRCDLWKKENCFQYNQGHNCGICAAVCPFGNKERQDLSIKRRM